MRAFVPPPAPLLTHLLLFPSQSPSTATKYQALLGVTGYGEWPAMWTSPASPSPLSGITAAHQEPEASDVLEEQNLLFIKQISCVQLSKLN
jgi:hypothetical protein